MGLLPTVTKAFVLLSCTFLGLICGTNYLYSSYSPQLATKLNYTAADSSKIAQFGTIGVAISGPISGRVVDKKGYTFPLIIGGLCILCGYLGLKKQFDYGHSSLPISYLMLFLIGSGSTFMNSACLKCCAISFPSLRGVATSLPLALYGLSALFYSVIGSIFFPGDTSKFLGFLAYSSLVIFALCAPSIILTDREHQLRKTVQKTNKSSIEMVTLSPMISPPLSPRPLQGMGTRTLPNSPRVGPVSSRSEYSHSELKTDGEIHGFQLIASPKFWLLFFLTGALSSMGQMYIYCVGYIVKALISKGIVYDENFVGEAKEKLEALIQTNQQLQVGLLSTTNCIGRLVSGMCGDIITQSFNKRRSWLLFVPSIGLTITQIMGKTINDYRNLGLMSLSTGFFYGFTFCILPLVVGDIFGMENFSMNWGIVCLAPILPSFYFTNLFGEIFDSHSTTVPDGSHVCTLGKDCYASIFNRNIIVTLATVLTASILNFGYHWLSKKRVEYSKLST